MQSSIIYKTSINSRRNVLNKSNSLNDLFPKSANKEEYKFRQQLIFVNSLSIKPSRKYNTNFYSNYNNYKTNYSSMIQNLISNDVDLKEGNKSGIKSLDNLFTNIKNLKKLSKSKNFFESKEIQENKKEINVNKYPNIISEKKNKKQKQNISSEKRIFLSEKKKQNKKKILNEKQFPISVKEPSSEYKKDNILNIKLVNQILKFDKTKSKVEKNNSNRDILPMKLGKNYNEFIERKIKMNYNPNFNSPNIHRMSLNFMLDKITKNIFNKNNKIKKKKLEEKNKKEKKMKLDIELMQEMRDNIEELSDLENIKKKVRLFLTDETKLNQITDIKEQFFDKFENKVNYLYDCRRFPVIKNNLNRIKIEITAKNHEWNKLNMLENCTIIYLNKLRTKIQRELDEIDEQENKEKEKQFRLYQDIGKFEEKNNIAKKEIQINENENSIDYIINIMKNGIKLKKEDTEENEDKEKTDKEDLYNLEEFFVHKSRPYKTIDFANERLSYIIFHNKGFQYIDSKKLFEDKIDYKSKSMANVFI